MKKLLSVALSAMMVLSLTGCGNLFVKQGEVKLNETYTHTDPENIKYDTRTVLKKEGFEADIETFANTAAYPDTMMYDEDGNPIGVYDYDETTGLALGWFNLADGVYNAFAAGEEIDLGKPDESMMIDIPGTVNFYTVLYGNEEKTIENHMYFFLSDANDMEVVKTNLEGMYGFELTKESETVLKTVEDESMISNKFAEAEEYGQVFEKKDANAYAELLKQVYGLRPENGANPYKAYEGHEDPADLDFDERVVYTASGAEAVYPENAKYISSMTNYVYAKDGVVIADYTYYESPTKEDCDALMEAEEIAYYNPERASDTALLVVTAGKDMEDLVSAYIGYTVMEDNSLEEYIKMLEGTYFSMESK